MWHYEAWFHPGLGVKWPKPTQQLKVYPATHLLARVLLGLGVAMSSCGNDMS